VSQATRKKTRGSWGSIFSLPADIFQSHKGRRLAAAAVVAVAVVVGSLHLWQQLRSHVVSQPEYLVAASDIEITPPPDWIHNNIKAAAIRDAGLPAKLSILDDRVTERLSQAFLLNPWIARVEKVQSSYPARVRVDLVYRRPVAMVEVFGGLLPVDGDAVLLPTEDFSPADAMQYPRIAGIKSSPLGPLGTQWGDPVVAAAAKLSGLLRGVWGDLQLHHISEHREPTGGNPRVCLDLVSRGGTVFVWGSAPQEETADELAAGKKLDRLLQWKTTGGSLDAVPSDERDLRRPQSHIAESQSNR
jgi:hypothetical protein